MYKGAFLCISKFVGRHRGFAVGAMVILALFSTSNIAPTMTSTAAASTTSIETINEVNNLLSSGLDGPTGLAFDSSGNLYIVNDGNNTITVIPKTTGTIFGQSVTANTPVKLNIPTGLLNGPYDLAFDQAGNLYVTNWGNGSTITVIPKTTGTVFGQSVTANTPVKLNAGAGLVYPTALAFDSSGNLYIANDGNSTITVIPKTTGTVFGQSNNLTIKLSSGLLDGPFGMAFDLSGNLYIANANNNTITVIPKTTGTIFGQPVTANTPVKLNIPTGLLNGPYDLAFDQVGNLYVGSESNNTITVIPKTTGTIFGQPVTANTPVKLNAGAVGLVYPSALAFDPSGNLYVANYIAQTVTVIPANTFEITTPTLPSAEVGIPYSANLANSGGLFGKSWSVSSGTLPQGLSLDSQTGSITGTPTTSGTSSFSVTARDFLTTASEHLSIFVSIPTTTTSPVVTTTTTTSPVVTTTSVVTKIAKTTIPANLIIYTSREHASYSFVSLPAKCMNAVCTGDAILKVKLFRNIVKYIKIPVGKSKKKNKVVLRKIRVAKEIVIGKGAIQLGADTKGVIQIHLNKTGDQLLGAKTVFYRIKKGNKIESRKVSVLPKIKSELFIVLSGRKQLLVKSLFIQIKSKSAKMSVKSKRF